MKNKRYENSDEKTVVMETSILRNLLFICNPQKNTNTTSVKTLGKFRLQMFGINNKQLNGV